MLTQSKSAMLATCLLPLGLLAFSAGGPPSAGTAPPADTGNQPAAAPEPAKRPESEPAAPPAEKAATLADLSREAERKIRTAMQTKIDMTLKETTIDEFVTALAIKGGFPAWTNWAALQEEGIAHDEPLTEDLHDVTIEQALNWTLPPWAVTWLIDDEVLIVTTTINAEERLVTRTYDVRSLLAAQRSPGDNQPDVSSRDVHRLQDRVIGHATRRSASAGNASIPAADDRALPPATVLRQIGHAGLIGCGWPIRGTPEEQGWLIELITNVTPGPWMEVDGTGGTIDILNDVLVIRHTWKMHEEIDRLLAALRSFAEGEPKRPIVVRPETYPFDRDHQIQAALTGKSSVKYVDTPLSSVVADLNERHEIGARINVIALSEEGIARDEPISITLDDVSLGTILHVMLEPLGVTYYVSDGALWITTEIHAEERLFTAVYLVRDLVEPQGDYDSLIAMLQHETSGPWGPVDGTGGEIRAAKSLGILAIRQTHKVHAELAQLLADLRTTKAAQPKDETKKRDTIEIRVYNLHDVKLIDDLVEAIPKYVEPVAWGEEKTSASIERVGDALVIRQTEKVHGQIEKFLKKFGFDENMGFGFGIR